MFRMILSRRSATAFTLPGVLLSQPGTPSNAKPPRITAMASDARSGTLRVQHAVRVRELLVAHTRIVGRARRIIEASRSHCEFSMLTRKRRQRDEHEYVGCEPLT